MTSSKYMVDMINNYTIYTYPSMNRILEWIDLILQHRVKNTTSPSRTLPTGASPGGVSTASTVPASDEAAREHVRKSLEAHKKRESLDPAGTPTPVTPAGRIRRRGTSQYEGLDTGTIKKQLTMTPSPVSDPAKAEKQKGKKSERQMRRQRRRQPGMDPRVPVQNQRWRRRQSKQSRLRQNWKGKMWRKTASLDLARILRFLPRLKKKHRQKRRKPSVKLLRQLGTRWDGEWHRRTLGHHLRLRARLRAHLGVSHKLRQAALRHPLRMTAPQRRFQSGTERRPGRKRMRTIGLWNSADLWGATPSAVQVLELLHWESLGNLIKTMGCIPYTHTERCSLLLAFTPRSFDRSYSNVVHVVRSKFTQRDTCCWTCCKILPLGLF